MHHNVAFRSAKARSFAERMATIFSQIPREPFCRCSVLPAYRLGRYSFRKSVVASCGLQMSLSSGIFKFGRNSFAVGVLYRVVQCRLSLRERTTFDAASKPGTTQALSRSERRHLFSIFFTSRTARSRSGVHHAYRQYHHRQRQRRRQSHCHCSRGRHGHGYGPRAGSPSGILPSIWEMATRQIQARVLEADVPGELFLPGRPIVVAGLGINSLPARATIRGLTRDSLVSRAFAKPVLESQPAVASRAVPRI